MVLLGLVLVVLVLVVLFLVVLGLVLVLLVSGNNLETLGSRGSKGNGGNSQGGEHVGELHFWLCWMMVCMMRDYRRPIPSV